MKIIKNHETDVIQKSRPFVTLAILTYNQEKLIKAAIQGALSQTYKPLEIIISDDCSSDSTYEIAHEVVKMNPSLNEVRVIRNNKNLGLISHINKVISQATGEVIILAAGDDISYPERCEKIVRVFQQNPSIHAIHTAYDTINEEGAQIREIKSPIEKRSPSDLELLYNGGGVGLGATYAYRRKCFTWPKALPTNLVNEDRILPWRAHLLGGVLYLNEPLVAYRLTSSGLSRDETIPRWPARKNKEHLKNLMAETVLSYQMGAIKRADLGLYTRFISTLFGHMDLLDLLTRRGGLPGYWFARCVREIFLLKYKLLKKFG